LILLGWTAFAGPRFRAARLACRAPRAFARLYRPQSLSVRSRTWQSYFMEQLLYQYHLNPTTWVYLASLLIITIYFKFSRLFSVRNLDLIGLILLAPVTLLVAQGRALALTDPVRGETVGQLG